MHYAFFKLAKNIGRYTKGVYMHVLSYIASGYFSQKLFADGVFAECGNSYIGDIILL